MKTNKFLLIALAAAGLMTACSNNEEVKPNQGKAISFRLQGGMPEAKTTASQAANVDAFVVYGSDDVNVDLFDGVSVVRKAGTTNFTYAPTRYYDEGAIEAAYIAYSPVSASVTSVVTDILNDPSTFTYKVLAPENLLGVTTQEDLLFTAKAVNPLATAIQLDFIHALSRVFITSTNTTSDLVTIESLTLNGLYSKGTIEVVAGATGWGWDATTLEDVLAYEYALAPSGVAVPAGSAKTLVTSMEQGMMILPQTTPPALDPDEVTLEVKYGIGTLTGQTKEIVIPNYKFEANNQYSIDVKFTDVAISFTITVTPFATPIKEVNP